MRRFGSMITLATLTAGMMFAATDFASAQKGKKLTYEQAYEKCRATDMVGFIGSDTGPGTSGRYARGSACMKKYGYRLKR